MPRPGLGPLALAGIVFLTATQALADQPRDDAARHYRVGADAFAQGRYAEAEKEFEESYALLPEPALLYNIGRARAALGHHATAAQTFDRYIATQPPSEERAKVEALAVEEHHLAELAQSAAPVVVPPTTLAAIAPPPPAQPRRFAYPVTVALGATALAFGVIAIGTGVASQHDYNHLNGGCSGCSDDINAGHRLQLASIATLALTGAALVGGAIALGIEHHRAHEVRR